MDVLADENDEEVADVATSGLRRSTRVRKPKIPFIDSKDVDSGDEDIDLDSDESWGESERKRKRVESESEPECKIVFKNKPKSKIVKSLSKTKRKSKKLKAVVESDSDDNEDDYDDNGKATDKRVRYAKPIDKRFSLQVLLSKRTFAAQRWNLSDRLPAPSLSVDGVPIFEKSESLYWQYCPLCHTRFARHQNAKMHLVTHHPELVHITCTLCCKRLKMATCELHLFSVHHPKQANRLRQKKLCYVCGSIKKSMKRHMLNAHSNILFISCALCLDPIGSMLDYFNHFHMYHMPYHPHPSHADEHAKNDQGYACIQCSKAFPDSKTLALHLLAHKLDNRISDNPTGSQTENLEGNTPVSQSEENSDISATISQTENSEETGPVSQSVKIPDTPETVSQTKNVDGYVPVSQCVENLNTSETVSVSGIAEHSSPLITSIQQNSDKPATISQTENSEGNGPVASNSSTSSERISVHPSISKNLESLGSDVFQAINRSMHSMTNISAMMKSEFSKTEKDSSPFVLNRKVLYHKLDKLLLWSSSVMDISKRLQLVLKESGVSINESEMSSDRIVFPQYQDLVQNDNKKITKKVNDEKEGVVEVQPKEKTDKINKRKTKEMENEPSSQSCGSSKDFNKDLVHNSESYEEIKISTDVVEFPSDEIKTSNDVSSEDVVVTSKGAALFEEISSDENDCSLDDDHNDDAMNVENDLSLTVMNDVEKSSEKNALKYSCGQSSNDEMQSAAIVNQTGSKDSSEEMVTNLKKKTDLMEVNTNDIGDTGGLVGADEHCFALPEKFELLECSVDLKDIGVEYDLVDGSVVNVFQNSKRKFDVVCDPNTNCDNEESIPVVTRKNRSRRGLKEMCEKRVVDKLQEAYDDSLQQCPPLSSTSTYAVNTKCHSCGLCLDSRRDLFHHVRGTHNGKYKCQTCKKVFISNYQLGIHMAVHTDERPFPCHVCGSAFKNQIRLRKHVKTHNKVVKHKYKCELCAFETNCISAIEKHMDEHPDAELLTCDKCKSDHFKFKSKASLNTHINCYHGQKVCKLCKFVAKGRIEIAAHKRNAHPKLKCNKCDYVGQSRQEMRKHVRQHLKEQPELHLVCDVCGKTFITSHQLSYHMKRHLDAKPRACDLCDYRCSSSTSLREHRLKHFGNKPYVCDICGFRTYKQSYIKDHKKTHSDATPYKCDVCGKGFKYRYNFQEHQRIHTGEKRFKCKVCFYGTQRKREFVWHLKSKKHGDEYFNAEKEKVEETSPDVPV